MSKTVVAGYKDTQGGLHIMGEELLGMGNPPSCPIWQAKNPGMGRRLCKEIIIELTLNNDGIETGRSEVV